MAAERSDESTDELLGGRGSIAGNRRRWRCPLGFLLSVNVNGPWQHSTSPSSDVVNASLRSDDGDRVGIGISDRDSPYGSTYLDGGFGLFPMAPLSFGTGYTAQAEGVVYAEGQSHPFSYRWRFSTQARPRGTVGDGRQSLRLRARTVRRGRPFRLVYLAAARGRISVSLTRRGRAYIRGTLNVRAGSGTVRVPAGRPGAYVLRAVLKTSVVTRLRQRVRVAG